MSEPAPEPAAENPAPAVEEPAPSAALPSASPLRPLAFVVAAAGLGLAGLAMATDVDLGWNLPAAILGCVVATAALLDGVGLFDGDSTETRAETPPLAFPWPRWVEFVAALVSLGASLRLAVAGVLPWPVFTSGALVTGSCLWSVVAVHRLAVRLGGDSAPERPLRSRHGFWLVAATSVLYLPMLGSFSLVDPWETHYGEVAREMLVRGDWLTFWWAQEGLFFSKPPLDFWLQGLAFGLFGVEVAPDRMLAGIGLGLHPAPEWAARFPIFAVALVGTYLFYRGIASAWDRRVGLIAGLVLVTMPYWFFLARQSMTDMPYAAPLAGAFGLLLVGFSAEPEARVSTSPVRFGSRVLHLGAHQLLLGAILLFVVPQVIYLATRNLTWQFAAEPLYFFRLHPDSFLIGSGGGNCGLPGNERCSTHWPLYRGLLAQPAATALFWSVLTGYLLAVTRSERRVQRLAFLGAWVLVAASALAKGAPGLVIPLFTVACFVVATGRYRDLARLELGPLVLIVAVIALPWYVQSFYRHGWAFLDRLIFHDMYKRAFVHVHDTNAGIDTSLRYYIWQLGYGTFPWSGLALIGLVAGFRRRAESARRAADGTALVFLWFVTGFALFTLAQTKFHHYALPVVPPLAVLTALLLERALGERLPRRGARLGGYVALMSGAAVALVAAVFFTRATRLLGGVDAGPHAPWWLGAGLALSLAGALGAAAVRLARPPRGVPASGGGEAPELDAADPASDPAPAGLAPHLGAVAILAAPIVALVGRDLTTSLPGDVVGPARLMHLFVYNYGRPWPPGIDFAPALFAVAVVGTVATSLWLWPLARPHAAALLLALGGVTAAFGVNVYLVAAAPHWGQRETIAAYYQRRQGPEEPLIAYQLNWKGENFYTGNRIAAFVNDPDGFRAHVTALRQRGQRVLFFATEQKTVDRLRREVGATKRFERLTPPAQNNKFAVVRVEL